MIVCDADGCGEEIAPTENYFMAMEQNTPSGKNPRVLHFHVRHMETKAKAA